MIEDINRAVANAYSAEAKMTKRTSELADILSEFIEFEFSISCLAGDGFTLLNENTTDVAFLGDCVAEIKEKLVLTEQVHEKLCV